MRTLYDKVNYFHDDLYLTMKKYTDVSFNDLQGQFNVESLRFKHELNIIEEF